MESEEAEIKSKQASKKYRTLSQDVVKPKTGSIATLLQHFVNFLKISIDHYLPTLANIINNKHQ